MNSPSANPALSSSGRRALPVLIVDDNEADRRLTAMCLSRAWPFESDLMLEYAADGRGALEKLQSKRFALAVLDWRLPKMDGGEVLRVLRDKGVLTPVVVVSGLDRESIGAAPATLGAAFLSKEEMTSVTLRAAIADSLRLLGLVKPKGLSDAEH